MRKVLFIGPSPLGIGGISIHIRRLSELMKNDYELDYVDEGHTRYNGMFNLRSGNIFKYLGKVAKADIVHINSGAWILRIGHIFVSKILFRKRVIVTIHRDPSIEPYVGVTKFFLKCCDVAILVNQEGYDLMKTNGRCRYLLLPAFLPPVMEEEPLLPTEVITWIEQVRQDKDAYLMTSNAWNLVLHNGEDLYGLDLCIDVVARLKDNINRKFYLLFVVASNTEHQELMTQYRQRIKSCGIEDRVLIWEEPLSFVRLLEKCDLVLRTTNTDGDAVSIREALYFGKFVVASDVVKRPQNVILFKTRDTADFERAIKSAITTPVHIEDQTRMDYHGLYDRIYGNYNKS